MLIYRLKVAYPGSPEIGFTTNGAKNEFYSLKPDQFPHLWDVFESDKVVTLSDGEIIGIGDEFYTVVGLYIKKWILTEQLIPDFKYVSYKTEQQAHEYLNSLIDIQIENEVIKGENIDLFGVCISDGPWIENKSNSFYQFERILAGKSISERWKYFRTEQERYSYIYWNKPIFSREDLNMKGINFGEYNKC